MKKLKLPFILFILLSVLNKNVNAQQQFSVKKIEQLPEIKKAYNLAFVPKSEKLLFTSENSNGLFVFDLKLKAEKKISTGAGAGFEPCISSDGKTVFYKTFTFDASGKRFSSLISQDIENNKITNIIENQRELSSAIVYNSEVSFISGNQIKSFDNNTKKIKACDQIACFTSPNMDLVVSENGNLKTINPLGKGNYIWVSLSPDQSKILFHKSGKSTYISDLEGNILSDLGRVHAARWSADGNYIIGMNDYDDGQKYISSEIVIYNSNGKNRMPLKLDSQEIALFPSLSHDNSKIVFNNEKGEAFLISLQ